MNTPLTPLQRMVADFYDDGSFNHIETVGDLELCGDTLFTFCIMEAGDMAGPYDLAGSLDNAIGQLSSLRSELVYP